MRLKIAVSILITGLVGNLCSRRKCKTFARSPSPRCEPRSWRLLNWRHRQRVGVQPLDQINTRNVERLQLPGRGRWKHGRSGDNATRLRRVCTAESAASFRRWDAATGDLLWEYRPEREKVSEGLAATATASKETSLSTETRSSERRMTPISSPGRPVRQADVGHRGGRSKTGVPIHFRPNRRSRQGYRGMTGCSRYKEDVCFISGHDAPPERSCGEHRPLLVLVSRRDTWGDLPLAFRPAATRWIRQLRSGSEPHLLGHGTAKPWARAPRTDGERSIPTRPWRLSGHGK